MKSLVHTEELCSRSVPLEHAPGAKPLVLAALKAENDKNLLKFSFNTCKRNKALKISEIQNKPRSPNPFEVIISSALLSQ